MRYTKELPLIRDVDVIVAGGGTAGLMAAVAAARSGARTVLVERHGFLGGCAVFGATSLHCFFNIFKKEPRVPEKQVVRGLAQELVSRLVARGGSLGHVEMERGYDFWVRRPVWRRHFAPPPICSRTPSIRKCCAANWPNRERILNPDAYSGRKTALPGGIAR